MLQRGGEPLFPSSQKHPVPPLPVPSPFPHPAPEPLPRLRIQAHRFTGPGKEQSENGKQFQVLQDDQPFLRSSQLPPTPGRALPAQTQTRNPRNLQHVSKGEGERNHARQPLAEGTAPAGDRPLSPLSCLQLAGSCLAEEEEGRGGQRAKITPLAGMSRPGEALGSPAGVSAAKHGRQRETRRVGAFRWSAAADPARESGARESGSATALHAARARRSPAAPGLRSTPLRTSPGPLSGTAEPRWRPCTGPSCQGTAVRGSR